MRIILLVTLLAVTALAQDQSADIGGAACGPKDVRFAVKQGNSQHTPSQPESGKALIYFVQETGSANCLLGACVTRIGLDGAWVGAFKHNSYFFVSVDLGEHHACMNVQSPTPLGKLVAFAHVTAEAGKVYYLGTHASVRTGTTRLQIDPIDGDQAKYLIASSPLSVSHPKP
jgi:hypothetical protein